MVPPDRFLKRCVDLPYLLPTPAQTTAPYFAILAMTDRETKNAHLPVALWRRLAALVYDLFISLALMMCVAALYHTLIDIWWYGTTQSTSGFNPALTAVLTFCLLFFFAFFWSKSGQTLGMQAWGIQLRSSATGHLLTFRQALVRGALAFVSLGLGGIGLLWILFDKDGKSLHDRMTRSEIVRARPLS